MPKGVLYVVATPIGNLNDVTLRALKVLEEVDLIAAEDTRHTRPLLSHHGIHTPMLAMHEHNEHARIEQLLGKLESGESLALVADAGTPLISDPGFPLVRQARRQGIRVVPVPGPSALICALSAAGLPTDRFLFLGFPPRHSAQRLRWFEVHAKESATLIYYESSHRILAALADMQAVFGDEREAVIGRELTKLHETFLQGTISHLSEIVADDRDQQKGEFVILVHGFDKQPDDAVQVDSQRVLQVLAAELPVKQAAKLCAMITGEKKNMLYQRILALQNEKSVS